MENLNKRSVIAITGECHCNNLLLSHYFIAAIHLLDFFENVELHLQQLTGECHCNNLLLSHYFIDAIHLLDFFENVEFEHVLRESN